MSADNSIPIDLDFQKNADAFGYFEQYVRMSPGARVSVKKDYLLWMIEVMRDGWKTIDHVVPPSLQLLAVTLDFYLKKFPVSNAELRLSTTFDRGKRITQWHIYCDEEPDRFYSPDLTWFS